ncbi:MAG: saccharopine dehydrogenase NADP-binding domain-containing protein [Planctomycetes bacterium]|nr:saccharopine dehydrogenase NADP-binding domain-containing protein [Planctomycetota bacterium]
MRCVVLGAGLMGKAAVHDLVRSPGVDRVLVADADERRAREVARTAGDGRAVAARIDVRDGRAVERLLRGWDVTLSAVPYLFNLGLARAAIAAGSHFCDLGGNDTIVAQELRLDRAARKKGLCLVPDCGLAPGMASLVVAAGLKRLDKTRAVHIRVGGLPQQPKPPLDYQLVFSVHGLINEYVEKARILRAGKLCEVESMTGVESLRFPAPFDELEAFFTSGGTSTLPDTLRGVVRDLDYKTIRYPGHCAKIRVLIDLGLTRWDRLRVESGEEVSPRAVLSAALLKALPAGEPDAVLLRVVLEGRKDGRERVVTYEMLDRFDRRTGLTAMMRTTAFPLSIVAQMLASRRVTGCGALPQEACIPAEDFLEELGRRGVVVRRRESSPR